MYYTFQHKFYIHIQRQTEDYKIMMMIEIVDVFKIEWAKKKQIKAYTIRITRFISRTTEIGIQERENEIHSLV